MKGLRRTKTYVVNTVLLSLLIEPGLKTEFQKKPMHPGVVVSKDKEEGKFKVAIISHRHPSDQPQKSIQYFDEETKVDGNVDLGHPKVVERTKMKPWRDGRGMGYTKPMSEGNLEKLKQALPVGSK